MALATPGHTAGCTAFVLGDKSKVFTGDALLVRGCGRTDFQGGDAGSLYDSVHSQLFSLPDWCDVYPAHDYKGQTKSSIAEEKRFNARLTKPREDFIELMANLKLSHPGNIHFALPANMACGYHDTPPAEKRATAIVAARLELRGSTILDMRTLADAEANPPATMPAPGAIMLPSSMATAAEVAGAAAAAGAVPPDKHCPIIAYCGSGKRAGVALTKLSELGYHNLTNAGSLAEFNAALAAAERS